MPLIAHEGAIDLLLRMLESPSGKISGSTLRAGFGQAGVVLLTTDLLTKVGETHVISAMDDYEDEPTRVEWCPERQAYGYSGTRGQWVTVPADDLALYSVKIQAFLAQLLVRCQRVTMPANVPLIPDRLWDLGVVKLDSRSKPLSVWFVCRLFDQDHRMRVETMAVKRPPAGTRVIITSTDDTPELQAPNHITVALRDVREATGGIAIDPAIVSKRLDLVPTSARKPIGHSADYGMI